MGTESVECVNGEITSPQAINAIRGSALYVAEAAPAMVDITAGTCGAVTHCLADDADIPITQSDFGPPSGADLMDEVDHEMLSSPEVIDAIRVMGSAYEAADRGEYVDWDDLIDRYGIG